MFALHTTFHVLILPLATLILIGGPRVDLLPVVEFASDGRSVDGRVIPPSRTHSYWDHQGPQLAECDLSFGASEFLEDSDDYEIFVSPVRGALSGSAAGCCCAAGSIVSRSRAWPETARYDPLFRTLCRYRC